MEEVETAFQSRLKTYRIRNVRGIVIPLAFLMDVKEVVLEKINEHVQRNPLKVNFAFICTYQRQQELREFNFKTKNEVILEANDLNTYYENVADRLINELDEFVARGSGWTLVSVDYLELRINKYNPLRGSSYIDLPREIKVKKAVVNVKNRDDKCFVWSILSALHPVDSRDHAYRTSKYQPYESELNMKGIMFPVALSDITKFEQLNAISVNVYGYQGDVYPLRITKDKQNKHVNLLYIKNESHSHYCWIKDLSRLIRLQVTKHKQRIYVCERCLTYYYSNDGLQKHEQDCKMNSPIRIEMPKENTHVEFKNFNRSMRVPFVIYADFECITRKVDTCPPDPTNSYTMKYQKHEPMSFCYYVKYQHEDYKPPVVYRGPHAPEKFIEMLREEVKEIEHIYNDIKPMNLTDADEKHFQDTDVCYICNKVIEDTKVRDHNHLTGKYNGPAHNECNLMYKLPTFVNVFIHNLTGYDAHLFVKALGRYNEAIEVIPNTEERYISFSQRVGKLN